MFNPRLFVIASSLGCLLATAAIAQVPAPTPVAAPAPAASGGAITRAEFPALLKETLINNPDILKDVFQKIRENQEAESKKKASESLAKNRDTLLNDMSSPSVGDPAKADVTIVEFFDYHCGYCKHMLPVITDLVKNDPKIRVIFKEYPILSEDSETASRAALAVHRLDKDKYFAFHTAMMEAKGKFDEKAIMAAAKKLGINGDKLKAEMGKKEITDALDANRQIGSELGITGTPSIIIGDNVMPGALSLDAMKQLIMAERNGVNKAPKAEAPKPAAPKPAAIAPAAAPAPVAAPAPAPAPAATN